MARRRRSSRRGMITVLALVGAAVILIAVGNLLKGSPRRRAPGSGAPVGAATPVHSGEAEIGESERAELETILERGAGR